MTPPQMYIQDPGLSPSPCRHASLALFVLSGQARVSLLKHKSCLVRLPRIPQYLPACTCYFSTEEDNHGPLFYLCVSFMPLPTCVFLLRPSLMLSIRVPPSLFPSPSLCPATCHLLGFVSPLPIREQDFVEPLRLPVSPRLVLGT